jgi:hypothetical protein
MDVKRGLSLREEHRLRVFEKMVLRRIFGPKKAKIIGGWRKLHNKSFMMCIPCQILLK